MSLIVEDGSIVENANSYVSLADARTYATSRGVTLSAEDATLEALLLKAMDYLESKRSEFQGSKTSPSVQSLQWPRYEVYIDGYSIGANEMPRELIQAQIQLAIEQTNGIDIQKSLNPSFVKKEVVGPLETEYSEKLSGIGQTYLTTVEGFLKPLLKFTGAYSIRSIRI